MLVLLYAAKEANLELVKCLIENGADIKPTLIMAIQAGEFNALKLLIDNGFVDVNTPPFDIRSEIEREPIIIDEYIIEQKPNINTLLTFSIKNRQLKITKLLIENGACLNTRGFDPLFTACKFNYTEIVELLITSILLKNPEKEKPNYIKRNNALSIYWDQQIDKINYLPREELLGSNNLAETILTNVSSGKNDSLLSISFQKFFKSLNPEIIKNKTSQIDQQLSIVPSKLGG